MTCFNMKEYKEAFRAAISKGMHPALARQSAIWSASKPTILF